VTIRPHGKGASRDSDHRCGVVMFVGHHLP
jgi:hypothetical protein